jgi:hypothetical protein
MIDYRKIKVGDSVEVVGLGAPGYANLGDTLEITYVDSNSVETKREDGETVKFYDPCGAKRLKYIDR